MSFRIRSRPSGNDDVGQCLSNDSGDVAGGVDAKVVWGRRRHGRRRQGLNLRPSGCWPDHTEFFANQWGKGRRPDPLGPDTTDPVRHQSPSASSSASSSSRTPGRTRSGLGECQATCGQGRAGEGIALDGNPLLGRQHAVVEQQRLLVRPVTIGQVGEEDGFSRCEAHPGREALHDCAQP